MQLVKRTFETHNSFIVHLFLCVHARVHAWSNAFFVRLAVSLQYS